VEEALEAARVHAEHLGRGLHAEGVHGVRGHEAEVAGLEGALALEALLVVHPDGDGAVDDVEDLVGRLVQVRRDHVALRCLDREDAVLAVGLVTAQHDREELVEDHRLLALAVGEVEGLRASGQDSGEG
jgi:hypothetical protein